MNDNVSMVTLVAWMKMTGQLEGGFTSDDVAEFRRALFECVELEGKEE